ncbi:unnamed protein product, partial [Brenthis ino]
MMIRHRNTSETLEEIKETEECEPTSWDPLTEVVKFIERHSKPLEKLFDKLPVFLRSLVATLGLITFGATLRGEWVIILVTAFKQISGHTQGERRMNSDEIYKLFTSKNLKMEHFTLIFLCAHAVSFIMYFTLSGFLHWYFYVRKRHLAHEWKIQPTKWLSSEYELDEIKHGSIALLVAGSVSAFIACYIFNENPSSVYFQFDEYGWLWFFLQFPVIFIYIDYTTYFIHRLYHTPWFYRKFHKIHHKYKQPTAFSATAIHPVEILHFQLTMCTPLFIMPVHWLPFYVINMYNYYHGIIDHSGIKFESYWWQPWQPSSTFHDQHHEFFHCNFGFNLTLWDKLHGTMRKTNQVYSEDIYYGKAIDSTNIKDVADTDLNVNKNLGKTKAYFNKQ